ncbi:MAG: PKD domain-containing protein, partial [Myxococcota bacterium]
EPDPGEPDRPEQDPGELDRPEQDPDDTSVCPQSCSSGADCGAGCGERIACVNGACSVPVQQCPAQCQDDKACQTPSCGNRLRCIQGRCDVLAACPAQCQTDQDCKTTACGSKNACVQGSCAVPANNKAPVALIEPLVDAPKVGERIRFDGRQSRDPDGDPLTFQWTIKRKPANSSAAFDDDTSTTPALLLDREGVFEVVLVVNDGKVDSAPVSRVFTARKDALPPPILSNIAPNRFRVDEQPKKVALFGLNFRSDSIVLLQNKPVTTTFVNAQQLEVTISGLAVGAYVLAVRNQDGAQSGNTRLEIAKKQLDPPRITRLNPSEVLENKPFTLEVSGTQFVQGARIFFDGSALN